MRLLNEFSNTLKSEIVLCDLELLKAWIFKTTFLSYAGVSLNDAAARTIQQMVKATTSTSPPESITESISSSINSAANVFYYDNNVTDWGKDT